jgi:proteasome accessory factor C
VRALAKKKEIPIARLCDELGVSEAELRADIELLSLCGLPPYGPENLIDIQIVKDRVRLSNRVLTPPPLQLSDDEAAGLRVVLRLAEAQGWPERKALASAVRKLEAALVPARREAGRRLARRVVVPKGEDAGESWLPLARRAIETKTSLEIDYYSDGREARTVRRVDPYRVIVGTRASYLIGWCHLRRAVLTFRLDRIVRAKKTSERFEPVEEPRRPAGAVGDARSAVGDTPAVEPDPIEVSVRFSPAVARLALETYPDAKPAPGGAALWKARVWPTLAFCRQILSWGGEAVVESPADVRRQVRDYARVVAASYEDTAD